MAWDSGGYACDLGRGVRGGTIDGEADEFRYNIVKDPTLIRDSHATIARLLGYGHEQFSFRYPGLDQRLTGVEAAHVIEELIA